MPRQEPWRPCRRLQPRSHCTTHGPLRGHGVTGMQTWLGLAADLSTSRLCFSSRYPDNTMAPLSHSWLPSRLAGTGKVVRAGAQHCQLPNPYPSDVGAEFSNRPYRLRRLSTVSPTCLNLRETKKKKLIRGQAEASWGSAAAAHISIFSFTAWRRPWLRSSRFFPRGM
jgi:hypothetical protein